jgi:hypothetical protein
MKVLTCACGKADWQIIQRTFAGIPDVKAFRCTGCQKEVNAFILTHPKMDVGLVWKDQLFG